MQRVLQSRPRRMSRQCTSDQTASILLRKPDTPSTTETASSSTHTLVGVSKKIEQI